MSIGPEPYVLEAGEGSSIWFLGTLQIYKAQCEQTRDAFTVSGLMPAKMLQITSPSGFEHFATEMGEPAKELLLPPPELPDVAKLLAVATKYHMEIPGPR